METNLPTRNPNNCLGQTVNLPGISSHENLPFKKGISYRP